MHQKSYPTTITSVKLRKIARKNDFFEIRKHVNQIKVRYEHF